MICPRCQKQVATVQVTEIHKFVAKGHAENDVREHRICESCAQQLNVPHTGMPAKGLTNFWQILQYHQLRAAKSAAKSLSCPECGMTWDEFRRHGRVGCERDYEVFGEFLEDQLERMHGSTTHVGHVPGEGEPKRPSLVELRSALAQAIEQENFERAAALRDEIETMESGQKA